MLPKSRDKYSKQQSTISIPSDDSSISFERNNSSFQDFEKTQKSVKIVGLGVFIRQGDDSLSTFNLFGRTTRNKSKPIHKDEYIIHPTDLNVSICLLHGPSPSCINRSLSDSQTYGDTKLLQKTELSSTRPHSDGLKRSESSQSCARQGKRDKQLL